MEQIENIDEFIKIYSNKLDKKMINHLNNISNYCFNLEIANVENIISSIYRYILTYIYINQSDNLLLLIDNNMFLIKHIVNDNYKIKQYINNDNISDILFIAILNFQMENEIDIDINENIFDDILNIEKILYTDNFTNYLKEYIKE